MLKQSELKASQKSTNLGSDGDVFSSSIRCSDCARPSLAKWKWDLLTGRVEKAMIAIPRPVSRTCWDWKTVGKELPTTLPCRLDYRVIPMPGHCHHCLEKSRCWQLTGCLVPVGQDLCGSAMIIIILISFVSAFKEQTFRRSVWHGVKTQVFLNSWRSINA